MNRLSELMVVSILLVLSGCTGGQSEGPLASGGLTFSDPRLNTAIRQAIMKPTGAIFPPEVAGTQWFSAARLDVSRLSGLRSLELLYLNNNDVEDVSPLSSLTSLVSLDLSGNDVRDVTALGLLRDLELLYMNGNRIEDLAPFSGLASLKFLLLSSNRINNIGALTDLASLTTFYLSSNQIEDITALSQLTSLTYLSLFNNQVKDLTELVNNPGIGTFDTVVLTENPLSESAITIQIPALKARRVTVIVTPTIDI